MSMWRNDIKYEYIFLFLLKNLAHKGLNRGIDGHHRQVASIPQNANNAKFLFFCEPEQVD